MQRGRMPMPDGFLPRRMRAHSRNREVHFDEPFAGRRDHALLLKISIRGLRLLPTKRAVVNFTSAYPFSVLKASASTLTVASCVMTSSRIALRSKGSTE